LAYEIEHNRALYSFADTGIAMLLPRSARCVRTARVLYSQILDQIERKGYDVFSGRARVPAWRKAVTAARIMVTGPRSLKRQAEAYQRGASPMSLRTRISRLPQPFRPTRVRASRSNAFSNHEKVHLPTSDCRPRGVGPVAGSSRWRQQPRRTVRRRYMRAHRTTGSQKKLARPGVCALSLSAVP
jgi:hypothetical protein